MDRQVTRTKMNKVPKRVPAVPAAKLASEGKGNHDDSAAQRARNAGPRKQRQLPFIAPPTPVTRGAVQTRLELAPARSSQLDGRLEGPGEPAGSGRTD
jgi:hypothetical protein